MGQQTSKTDDIPSPSLSAEFVGNETGSQSSSEGVRHDASASESASSSFSGSTSLPKPFTKSEDWNAKFLLGNLENLPASARKLFSMGKLYLTSDQSREREAGYHRLFQTLSSHDAGDSQEVALPNGAECDEDPTEKEISGPNPFLQHVKKMTNLFVPMQNSAPLNCTQTYVQWRAAHDLFSMYSLCLPTRNIIYIQPIDDFPPFLTTFTIVSNPIRLTFFEMLQGFVQIFFSGMEVIIQPPIFIQDEGWNVKSRFHEATNQRQYCVTDLYPCLQNIIPKDGRCIVGISWTDLYPEGFNFVLGEASNIHKSAVISFGRFETTNFNPESHSDISEINGELVWKLLKTISHEVCHVFGFSHCSFFLCAMNESSSVSHALSQPLFLCPVCLRKLQRVCGFDILDRYRLLLKFLANLEQQTGDSRKLQEAILWLHNCIEYLSSSIGE